MELPDPLVSGKEGSFMISQCFWEAFRDVECDIPVFITFEADHVFCKVLGILSKETTSK